MSIPCQRHLFDLPDDVAYLRCAASAPQPKAVRAAAEAAIAARSQPWTAGKLADPDAVERLRSGFARLIGAAADDVAIVPAASYGLSVAAANLPLKAGQRILTLEAQFPSNVYPWRVAAAEHEAALVTVARPEDGDWTPAVLAAIDEATAVVALPAFHWTDGSRLDLAAISARARGLGAALVLDLSQSLGAVPFDVAEIRPDYLVTVGQKWLMGPHQLAFFYAAPERQGGRPIEHNWVIRRGSEDDAGLVNYVDDFQPGARRFDGGARGNPVAIPMAEAALAQVEAWGIADIAQSLRPMVDEIADRAEAIGLVPTPARARAPHFIGLRAPDGLPEGIAERLGAAGVHVSLRGDAIRVAPHLYNTDADIERLDAALKEEFT